MEDENKYYLKADFMNEYKEVSKQEFINAEQSAGFRSKLGPDHLATGGFSGRGVSGRIEYSPNVLEKWDSKKFGTGPLTGDY